MQKAEQEKANKAGATYWFAVFSIFLGVTGLVGAEFLPISLLTPLAADLRISAGMAGQSIAAVGVFAVAASLLLAPLLQTSDRRLILLALSALLAAADAGAALAPNFALLLLTRAALGMCVGGFWSLAAATVQRLAAPHKQAKALSFVFAGVSAATLLAVPAAGYAEPFIGWRGVFGAACLLAVFTFFCQYKALPPMPAGASARSFKAMGEILQTRWAVLGLAAVMCSFAGYYVLFTYMRPFFEQSLKLGGGGLSFALLAFGLANCGGTFLAGFLPQRFLRHAMLWAHGALAAAPLALWLSAPHRSADIALMMLWAALFGLINVCWSAWILRTMPERAEPAGGLLVAAIQFSIMFGAALGGLILDISGIKALFPAAFLWIAAAVLMLALSFSLFARQSGGKL